EAALMARHRLSLLVDEPVPWPVVAALRARGHEVHLVADLLPAGASDALVGLLAAERGWTLVTWNDPGASSVGEADPARIDFRGDESHARRLVERHLPEIEAAHARAGGRPGWLEVVERSELLVRGGADARATRRGRARRRRPRRSWRLAAPRGRSRPTTPPDRRGRAHRGAGRTARSRSRP